MLLSSMCNALVRGSCKGHVNWTGAFYVIVYTRIDPLGSIRRSTAIVRDGISNGYLHIH
jgi:hypothetical protein